jgi:peroxiredoxin
MKRILLIAAVSGSLLTGCNSSNFTVTGTIEGVTDGKVYLIGFNETNRGGDTLAVAPVSTEGKFTLTGKVEGVQLSTLSIEGKNSRFPFLLEKGDYTATITNAPANEEGLQIQTSLFADIKGGALQEVFKQFNALQQEINHKRQELQIAYFSTPDTIQKDSIEQLFIAYQKAAEDRELEIIKANPDSYATAFQLYNTTQGLNLEAIKEKYNLLGEKGKATKYGKMIEEHIQSLENVAVGQTAPDFQVATPEGETLSLYGVEAKVKLIDFWASWCGPCRGENPNVVAAYAEYHPKGLEIIGVSLDTDKDAWLKAVADDQLTWKHGFDPKGDVATIYAVTAIPHTLLLDKNNKIIAKNLRGNALKEKLAELLD